MTPDRQNITDDHQRLIRLCADLRKEHDDHPTVYDADRRIKALLLECAESLESCAKIAKQNWHFFEVCADEKNQLLCEADEWITRMKTPRTDEIEDQCSGKDHFKSYHLMRNLAQELELELADALEDAKDHKHMLTSLSKTQALDRAELDRSFRYLIKQRDTLAEQLEANRKATLVIERMVYEAREQRDTLVDALRKAVAWGDAASMHILYRENINWELLDEARETLNANLTKPGVSSSVKRKSNSNSGTNCPPVETQLEQIRAAVERMIGTTNLPLSAARVRVATIEEVLDILDNIETPKQ